jgi:hypothetical protein
MPKRLSAILFASLASLMLLVHGIIPHHHHGDVVCFEVMHCHGCDKAEHNDCQRHHDHEPAENNGECCLLNQMVMFHPDGLRHDIEAAGQPAENDIPAAFKISLLSDNLVLGLPGLNLPFRQHPPGPTYLSDFVCHGLGLRAPPSA